MPAAVSHSNSRPIRPKALEFYLYFPQSKEGLLLPLARCPLGEGTPSQPCRLETPGTSWASCLLPTPCGSISWAQGEEARAGRGPGAQGWRCGGPDLRGWGLGGAIASPGRRAHPAGTLSKETAIRRWVTSLRNFKASQSNPRSHPQGCARRSLERRGRRQTISGPSTRLASPAAQGLWGSCPACDSIFDPEPSGLLPRRPG